MAERNDAPACEVGGEGVDDDAPRCDALNASAMGDSAACCAAPCCSAYGCAPVPVFERTGGFAGEDEDPEREDARAWFSFGDRLMLRFGSWLFCSGDGERTGRAPPGVCRSASRLFGAGGSGRGWLVLNAGGSGRVGVLRPES